MRASLYSIFLILSLGRMKTSATTLLSSDQKPTIRITNDDGINAPGLRALVSVLVSTSRYIILVCAPDMENSAVSHSITWRHPISARRADIDGATAFAISGLLNSGTVPDLVISGINKGSNCGSHIVYSGTFAGAREAFLYGVPSVSISYKWVGGKSSIRDFTRAAKACLPIINALLDDIRNQTYPHTCFLNIDVPVEVANHKGYKLTKQGRSIAKVSYRQVTSGIQEGKVLPTMTVKTESASQTETDTYTALQDHLLFEREAKRAHFDDPDTDWPFLRDGHITVTPLAAPVECRGGLPSILQRLATKCS